MEDSRADERFRQIDWRFDRLETSIEVLGAEIRESHAQLHKEIQDSTAQLRQEMQSSNAELRAEIRHSAAELRAEIQATNTRIDTMQRTLIQVGGGLIGTIIVASAGLIATQI